MGQDQHGAIARLGAARAAAGGAHASRTLENADPRLRGGRLFVGALRHDRIDAPWIIDGPINGDLFTAYVTNVLVPTLSRGDVVILDNLGSHKRADARKAIRAAGAHLLFLPAYSPDLNPIEQVFAKLKHLVRKAAPRTVEDTWRKVGDLLDLFSPKECARYLTNSGYASV